MSIAFSFEAQYPAIADFITDQTLSPVTFNCNIHSDDEMLEFLVKAFPDDYNRALLSYFKSGQESMNRVRQVANWKFEGLEKVESFLEFACGYGRLTRFLVQELSPAKIWVSDIYKNAITFQQEQFHVTGIDSVANPEEFRCDRKFDFIFVASLFSHLPEATFTPWLRTLFNLLTPNGVLVFSVHDQVILPNRLKMPESGFCFVEVSESKSLSTRQYGSTWVTEDFVKNAIATATDQQSSYKRIAQGLWEQDLYIVVKNPEETFHKFEFFQGPRGHLGKCQLLENNQLHLRGWAVDLKHNTWVDDIKIIINQQLIQRCIPYESPLNFSQTLKDNCFLKSGWSCTATLPPNTDLDTARLMVKVVNSHGSERVIYANLLKEALSEKSSSPDLILKEKFQLGSYEKFQLFARNLKQKFRGKSQPWIQGSVEQVHAVNSLEGAFKGWAIATHESDTIIDIQIWINGQLKQRCIPHLHRPDVARQFGHQRFLLSGWTAQFEVSRMSQAGVLIKAVTQQNRKQILYAGMLEDLLS